MLSVIIPCCNTEKYLRRCLDSLLAQTYKEFEVILIDDGSSDMTGAICDEYAKIDSRIVSLHQSNKGQSITRWGGVKMAKYQYVTFIDSDDWIYPQTYEIMMKAILNERADIGMWGVCDVYQEEDGLKFEHRYSDSYDKQYMLYGRIEATKRILEDKEWKSYFWNKIFKKKILLGIEFKRGMMLDEDLLFMHQAFNKCERVVVSHSEFHYYLHRKNSITNSTSASAIARCIEGRNYARFSRYEWVKKNKEYSSLENLMANIALSVLLANNRFVIKHKTLFESNYIDKCICLISQIKTEFLLNNYFSTPKKIEYFLFKLNTNIYKTYLYLYSILK